MLLTTIQRNSEVFPTTETIMNTLPLNDIQDPKVKMPTDQRKHQSKMWSEQEEKRLRKEAHDRRRRIPIRKYSGQLY